VSGAVAFRQELSEDRQRVRAVAISTGLGAVVGATLLLALPSRVFEAVVPWCVLFSSALLALAPWLGGWVRAHTGRSDRAEYETPAFHAGLFVAGVYGAYFGGGLGVILLAVLGLFLSEQLHANIGLKNVLQLLVNTIALVVFVFLAPVAWSSVAVVAPAAFVGGLIGARLGRSLPAAPLRVAIVVAGLVVGVVLLLR
jgi:uncharacterized membrane protein YfcA